MGKPIKTLEYFLKDFSPDRDYKEEWTDTQIKGRKILKQYDIDLTKSETILHPFMVYIIFVMIKGYPYLPRFEKIAWEIPIKYKGLPFVLGHKKWGFSITSNEDRETNQQYALEIIQQIKRSIPFAETLISPLIQQQVNSGNITIVSRYKESRNRYIYHREKVQENSNSDKDALKEEWNAFEVKIKGRRSLKECMKSYERAQMLEYVDQYHVIAMIDSYFSYIEHISVLLLPFLKYINLQEIEVGKFISETWKSKLKILLKADQSRSSIKHIENLEKIKEAVRNPSAHGYYQKKGHSFLVHMPRLGAIPFVLTKSKSSRFSYSLIDDELLDFKSVCEAFDDFDKFLDEYDTRFGLQYIKEGLPVAFDEVSTKAYRKRMVSDASTKKFIKEATQQIERAINMDW